MVFALIFLQFLSGVFADSLVISRSDEPDYISMFPRFADSDESGNIYVAEMAEMAIRKYDQDGNFVQRIGRKGRGPGEMQDVTTFSYHNNELWVVDFMSARFIRFSTDGKILQESLINQQAVSWPRQIIFHDGSPQVLSVSDDSDSIIKSIDTNFKVLSAMLPKSRVYQDDAIAMDYMALNPGTIVSFGEKILFAPFFYSGTILSLDPSTNKVESISGRKISGLSHEVLSKDAADYSIRYGGSMGITKLKVNHESRGLFTHKNRLYHFIQITESRKKIFCYEVYDSDLDFITFVPIAEKIIPQGAIVDIPISIKAIDNQGRVIIHNYETASLVAYTLTRSH